MLFNACLITSLAVIGVTVAKPVTPETLISPVYQLDARSSATNIVYIGSESDYCLIVPKNKHTNIGDSEYPGGETTYCANPHNGQGKMPSDFWTHVTISHGTGKKSGKKYIQMAGCIKASTLDRLNANDDGGQYDSNGGSGGHGNPSGSTCVYEDYLHYVEIIEPAGNRACIRCCQSTTDCPTNFDTDGCPKAVPSSTAYEHCDD